MYRYSTVIDTELHGTFDVCQLESEWMECVLCELVSYQSALIEHDMSRQRNLQLLLIICFCVVSPSLQWYRYSNSNRELRFYNYRCRRRHFSLYWSQAGHFSRLSFSARLSRRMGAVGILSMQSKLRYGHTDADRHVHADAELDSVGRGGNCV